MSYTWGSREQPFNISIEDAIFPVTVNLYAALEALRHPYEDRILWTDAIYIDQGNVKRRGHQVRQMNSIYCIAREIIVWLGSSSLDTGIVLDDLRKLEEESVRRARNNWQSTDKRWHNLWDFAQIQQYTSMGRIPSSQYQKVLWEIFHKNWFLRIWII